jgi:hypothetical protein
MFIVVVAAEGPCVEKGTSVSTGATTDDGTSIGKFTINFYWVEREEDHTGTQTFSIHTLDSTTSSPTEIGQARQDFVEHASLVDNGLLEDGSMISFQSDCSAQTFTVPFGVCFELISTVSFPQGRSLEGNGLLAYQGVRVDSTIAQGTKLFITLLKGIEMPGTEGGFAHTGCIVADNSGASTGTIEVFVFRKSNFTSLDETLGSKSKYTSDVFTSSPNCN